LSILVNNASSHAFENSLDGWKRQIEIDLLGAMYATHYSIETMRCSGGGAIVNIASISGLWHGRRTPGGIPVYDAAKAALIHLTIGLRDLSAEGIRVNCLAPGWIATHGPLEYWQSLTPEERQARRVPARLLTPEQIATAVYRLATDKTLSGRVLLWWSEDVPRLIADGDRGYFDSVEFDLF
jgi:NAD(P)-dependent dehydrogenase (short-subunit alcohol dehydrogenase family)